MGALGYPFALCARRPGAVIGAFLLLALADMGIELLLAAGGADPLRTPWAVQIINLASGVFNLMAGAFVMGVAMVDLKRRVETPSVSDGVLFFVLNLKFSVTIGLPTIILAFVGIGLTAVVTGYPQRAADPGAAALLMVAIGAVCFLPLLYFVMRLYPAWPMSLTDGRSDLFRAWSVSKGKFWLITAVVVLSYLIGLVPVFLASMLLNAFGFASTSITSLQAALSPEPLLYTIVTNTLVAFSCMYTALAAARLFDEIGPQSTSLADAF